MSARALLVPACLALATFSACSDLAFNAGIGADIGVTPGGSQDIGFARDGIARGEIPDQSAFTAEGLFSEHDLPLSGPACEDLLCPRVATTVHRSFDGQDKVLAQLGFGTSVNAAEFERDALDLVLLVDTSGSMSGEPLELSREGMLAILDQVDENDRVGLVEFGSRARVLQRSRTMDARGRDRLRKAIEGLETNGSTDMESGMREAYGQLDASFEASQRLMIFSDARPNTGLTAESDFVSLVRDQADAGVGTTFFGVGAQLDADLSRVISEVKGGNAFFVSEESHEKLFVDEFDFVVTPIAYDLDVRVVGGPTSPVGAETYGAPVDGDEVAFGASTLFLSSRAGGMGATFDVLPEAAMTLGSMTATYTPVGASEPVTRTVIVDWKGGAFAGEADDRGVFVMDALVSEYKALVAAADLCDGEITAEDAQAAIAHAREALTTADAELGGGTPLTAEVSLMDALRALVEVDEASLSCMSEW